MSVTGAAVGHALARAERHTPGARTRSSAVYERNLFFFRRNWMIFVTGFAEPFLWLFSIGIGVGELLPGFVVGGRTIGYADFVAPAMLATSAMNGAIADSTFNVFFKLKYGKVYDAMLATPVTTTDIVRGDLSWAITRGGLYSAGFLAVMAGMGTVSSWWALLALPAAVLTGFAFGGMGFALTTFMRSWQDFEFVQLALIPMLLFSATFYPITAFPEWGRWIVEVTPLYRSVVLVRELTTGLLTWGSAVSVLYLLGFGLIGIRIASGRMTKLLCA